MKTIVLASNNAGKLAEFNKLFAPLHIQVVPQREFNVIEAEESGHSFAENALLKALSCAKQTNLPAIADDSGLCVESLAGAPGIYSARYAGLKASDKDNIDKLLLALAGQTQRKAFFNCALAYVEPHKAMEPIIVEGQWHGEILTAPQGENGFGYDPIFWLPELGKTAAEIDAKIKNQLSHRALALKLLLPKLERVLKSHGD